MALFQISEPGQAPEPHQRKLAIGIDLGTTNSLVATVRSGVAEVLPDAQGVRLTPSVVHYAADAMILVGQAAIERQVSDPANTIASVKRLMGRSADEAAAIAAGLGYAIESEQGLVRLKTRHGAKTPVEVSAEILKTLRERAEASLQGELVGAVITVPAYFDEAQRQATKDAARLAGLHVLRLLNEPTAAAVAYGLDQGARGIYAVYDLGGGTFDISILRLTDGVFEVLATGGDTALGGDDFDHRIAGHLKAQAQLKDLNPHAQRDLLQHARRAKEQLTDQPELVVRAQLVDGQSFAVALTRADLEALCKDLVQRSLQICRKALRDADLALDACDGVVLVGGSTRMPLIRAAVEQFFNRKPYCDLNPDEVVALGAAIQANSLAGNKSGQGEWLLLDVVPLSLGIETYGGLVEKLIPRNATLPIARAQEFTTFKDGQTALALHVLQGERELAKDCRSLARFELRGIPPMAAGAARIRVTFQVDADGLLSVQAQETTSGVAAHVTVKPSYGLSDEQIASMLIDANQAARADMQARSFAETKVEADRLLEATRSALRADGDLLTQEQRSELHTAMAQLLQAREAANRETLSALVKQLAEKTEPFAALRMDKAVKSALAGKKLDDFNA